MFTWILMQQQPDGSWKRIRLPRFFNANTNEEEAIYHAQTIAYDRHATIALLSGDEGGVYTVAIVPYARPVTRFRSIALANR